MTATETGTRPARPDAIKAVPVRHPGRWVAIVVIAVLGAMLVNTIVTNPRFNWSEQWKYAFSDGIRQGVVATIWLTIASMLIGVVLGVVIPFGPEFTDARTFDLVAGFSAALLGLGLNEGAYMAEIVRGGLISVDEGQWEASSALGMTRMQTLRRIVLPQAMRVIVPPTGNETISMLKTTSLVSVIAYAELLYSAQIIYGRTFQTIPLLLVASIWYLA